MKVGLRKYYLARVRIVRTYAPVNTYNTSNTSINYCLLFGIRECEVG